ncbi:MAG: Gp19/Gp15/Gp42 family protein [Bifidobacterium crudilactis]|jgi:hypothetical protein
MSSIPSPPFAQTTDLEARWHTLTASEQAQAKVLIDDASDKIITVCPRYENLRPLTLTRITCAMVQRAMSISDDALAGATQHSETTGPMTDSWSYSNPDGALYLKKQELHDLGVGVQKAFSIDMGSGSVT